MFSTTLHSGRLAAFGALCLAVAGLTAGAPAARGQSSAEEIRITLGKSIVIDYPVDVARISTSNPEIVDAVAVSTREVLLHAKAHGICTIVVWSKAGQRTFYNISVEHNLEPIRRILKETFPNDPIQIQSARDSITLTGKVTSQGVSDRAGALAASLSKTVINNLQINPAGVEKQILLRVKFAELNRSISHSFGVNLLSTGALDTPGAVSTSQFSPPRPTNLRGSIPGQTTGTTSEFTLTDALNVFAFRPDLNLAATIRALQTEGVLQIIAEPNLVTTNAKEASFLVGGEFPVPVLQGGANAAVTVQFREFGIRLTFNPQLTPHGTMKMYVKPEVSTIDLANAVTLSGFTIPALATRRMETNIELGPGQSFVIGGLIDDRVTDQMSRIPGLSSIPVLGSLFKSRNENKTKTELLVMVSPEIVDPLNPGDPKPMPVMPRDLMPPVQIKPTSQKGVSDPVKSKARKLRAQEKAAPVTVQPVSAGGESKDTPKTGGESH
ncbi:MAG: pilus assembly protein N-terminal domain-containing protein [Acidobacteria bacterium]|nr:pilus assembly protein N-terminal domain-containing protein [Acidobacteriota bacterium]